MWFAESGGIVARIDANGAVTEYPDSFGRDGDLQPTITSGPDGNLWFTEPDAGAIAKLTPTGTVTHYGWSGFPIKGFNPNVGPGSLATGADGDVWFSDPGEDRLGKVTPQGAITVYPAPAGSAPAEIAGGPDGSVWFTEQTRDRIGKLAPDGAVTEYPVTEKQRPTSIAVARDGTAWFTEEYRGMGKVTPAGVVDERYTPDVAYGLTAGPDGTLWFLTDHAIGKISPAGEITKVVPDQPLQLLHSITAGPDGNLWFTQWYDVVGKLTPSGTVTAYHIGNRSPGAIVPGADGNLWVSQPGGVILRITTRGALTEYQIPGAGPAQFDLARGADGNVWFANAREVDNPDGKIDWFASVGKITPVGRITEYGREAYVTVSIKGHGRVSFDRFVCVLSCREALVFGTTTRLTATPDSGYRFAGWRGACRGHAACRAVVRQGARVTAVFEKRRR
jgi:streptogramin lyase